VNTDSLQHALALLPHGPEFRFIDRLTALVPGKEGTAEFSLKGNEPFLRGHFPGRPILPGVILLEAAAQLVGIVAQSDPEIEPLPGLKLTAIRNAKILGTARPGEAVRLRAQISGRMNHLIQASVSADVNGSIVLETLITLSGEPRAEVR
jgi:3-hydroxyacyl-[acyl-carrier-protein] dehydratase